MEPICSSETSVDFKQTTRDVISQKTVLYITTAVRTSNSTIFIKFDMGLVSLEIIPISYNQK
jgi:hypothetical protein